MRRFLLMIIIMVCAATPSWGKFATQVVAYEKIDYHEYTIMLDCNAANSDTVYHFTVKDDGRVYRSKEAVMLLKLGGGEVVELHPDSRWCMQEIDSMYYNNEGEPVFIYRDEMVYFYPIDRRTIEHIISKGVLKVRLELTSATSWAEKTWKSDVWGKKLGIALNDVEKQLSPDYVPPKKKTIYDGF